MIAALVLTVTTILTPPVANEGTHFEFDLDATLDMPRLEAREVFQSLPDEFHIIGRLEIYEDHPLGVGGFLSPCQALQRERDVFQEAEANSPALEREEIEEGVTVIPEDVWEAVRDARQSGHMGWGVQIDQLAGSALRATSHQGECAAYRATISENPKEITSMGLGRITLIEVIESWSRALPPVEFAGRAPVSIAITAAPIDPDTYPFMAASHWPEAPERLERQVFHISNVTVRDGETEIAIPVSAFGDLLVGPDPDDTTLTVQADTDELQLTIRAMISPASWTAVFTFKRSPVMEDLYLAERFVELDTFPGQAYERTEYGAVVDN